MHDTYETVIVRVDSGVCRVTLNRPNVHNAFNATLIRELNAVFAWIKGAIGTSLRVVVLSGEGRSFCAGADVNWMRESRHFTRDENRTDAARMAELLDEIDTCLCPGIARIHGSALGGGAGLAAVSDIVIAEEKTAFAFSEVKLGIAPAVIAPYVLAKIGRSHARALFLTGERFGVERAKQIGLVHISTSEDELDAEVKTTIEHVYTASPAAVARAKELIARVPDLDAAQARLLTVNTISELRASDEGQEGLGAFLEKRKPKWAH